MKVAPRDELRGYLECVPLAGIEPATHGLRQKPALSTELQRYTSGNLWEVNDKMFFALRKCGYLGVIVSVLRQKPARITSYRTKAP